MKNKLFFQVFLGVVLCTDLAMLLACGAVSPTPTPFPTLRPTPTPVVLPSFLFFVFPEPGSTSSGVDPTRHSWAILNLPAIAESGETLKLQDLQERTWLLIDGQPLEFKLIEGYSRPDVEAEVRAALSSPLDPGEHQVTVRVRRTSGEMLEFNWSFTVDRDAGAFPGLPQGLTFVRPFPDSTVTREDYRNEELTPPGYGPDLTDLFGGVCYGLSGARLFEPGDFTPTVSDKAHFVALDGVSPGPDANIERQEDLALVDVYDEAGQLIGSHGGHSYSCWRVDLAPGRHEVTVQLDRASGPVTFTWWFVITDH